MTYIPKIKSKEEARYIRKRKNKGFADSLLFIICRIFPVDKNLVSVCTFEGRGGFGCNPKYIVQELHKQKPECKIVWFVNDRNKAFPEYVKKVPNHSVSRAYWLSRSKVWIDNYRKPYGTRKRKGQYYINTWHSGMGFKTIGLLRGEAFSYMAYLVSKNDSDMIDDVVVDSDYCEKMFRKGLVYHGHFLKVGQPRCDILNNDRSEYMEQFRQKHHLPSDAKVVMYAPTFRECAQGGKRQVFSEIWSIDFERLIRTLESRFGGQWYVCVRVHPQLAATFQEYKNEKIQERMIDESRADDMYEILAGMDAFVTDYSSAAFDASETDMPVFIYADDIEQYVNDRGNLLWNLSADTERPIKNNKYIEPDIDAVLPFSVAKNNDELEDRILTFEEEKYRVALCEFRKKEQLVENHSAAEKIVEIMETRLHQKKF
jgi:CDP-glycerol glycerophosphotransferase (TagB/SpsB family)